jgi:hypothetical protein
VGIRGWSGCGSAWSDLIEVGAFDGVRDDQSGFTHAVKLLDQVSRARLGELKKLTEGEVGVVGQGVIQEAACGRSFHSGVPIMLQNSSDVDLEPPYKKKLHEAFELLSTGSFPQIQDM